MESNPERPDNIPLGSNAVKKIAFDDLSSGTDYIPEELRGVIKKPKFYLDKEVEKSCKTEILLEPDPQLQRCSICSQYLHEALLYNGHPNNSVEEYITLTNDALQLFTGDEDDVHAQDTRPLLKITHFSVYDLNGHLCPFDSGLIESNKLLYFSGYVKPIYIDDPTPADGLPTKDMGPINEWFISGFDGGEKALVGFSTEYAEYYLVESSDDYKPIMKSVGKKILLSKIVIEYLLDEGWQNPTYEDLLQALSDTGDPELNEETLIRNAQFVCDRVTSFDNTAAENEPLLITAPCMRSLIKITGVSFKKARNKLRTVDSSGIRKKSKGWSKATVTKLVSQVFENFFKDQLAKKENEDKGPRRHRCGVCEACQTPDCGTCVNCRDMLKFGGTGRSKQACLKRRCPYMAIEDANEESDHEEDSIKSDEIGINRVLPCSKKNIIHRSVKFLTPSNLEHSERIYYDSAKVGDLLIEPGDHVMLNSEEPNEPLLIAYVCYLWKEPTGEAMFHAYLYCRGSNTVLGETSDPRELFMVDICDNCPLGSIVSKAKVEYRSLSEDWAHKGGIDELPPQLEDDGQTFFYSKRYDSEYSRFEDVINEPIDDSIPDTPCRGCKRRAGKKKAEKAIFDDGCVKWRGDVYKIGSGVFIENDSLHVPEQNGTKTNDTKKEEAVDENVYPEFYRKPLESNKLTNKDIPEPFDIGLIKEISKFDKNTIIITVRKFYRPENTRKGVFLSHEQNLNLLYWSDEEYKINFDLVQGKCYLCYGNEIDGIVSEWSSEGPYRFYFNEGYDGNLKKYVELPYEATKIGYCGKGTGKSKGKGKSKKVEDFEIPPKWPKINDPLKCMDVFAGCGGLSEGLHRAGVAETKWAIEKDATAAQAFRLNNPDCMVYTDDCNDLLKVIMSDDKKLINKRKLPRKGEVELMVGGPPCQGFSGMNRFNAGQYSLFKNSLIVSYLSYCDYYRPVYFILENVRNFVSFKRSMVLKLTLRCLLAIGYQVTFGIVQAGSYGVPQTRRRLIIMAAAPGFVLPKYPEPQHVFSKKACQLSVLVDNFKFYPCTNWTSSAPFRTITVRDAMSDLPDIKNGWSELEMNYDGEPMSHFQRVMRASRGERVKDHICKDMAPLVAARMSRIPLYVGADWRDLPNITIRLSDGSMSNKLRYPYKSKKQKNDDPPRGVCLCATGKSCDPEDRQFNTLIPWCLPHTADRHNHWAGLYGRLEWDGIFSTTVTNPEPMGKQGRVLHPEQHRVVSVRECARSQGFPDSYQFHGSILDKHRQVGNAVPPPLGCALGREILKAYITSDITLENLK